VPNAHEKRDAIAPLSIAPGRELSRKCAQYSPVGAPLDLYFRETRTSDLAAYLYAAPLPRSGELRGACTLSVLV